MPAAYAVRRVLTWRGPLPAARHHEVLAHAVAAAVAAQGALAREAGALGETLGCLVRRPRASAAIH
jgi:hypothetical protein